MASDNVKKLTRADIIRTAKEFTSNRKTQDWTVIVEDRELPARPLVLEAAGVPPNDPTNSHQAVAILKELGFVTHYQGKSDERYVVMTVQCEHCKTKQAVKVAAKVGFGQMGDQWIACVNCKRDFGVMVPDRIIGGPFAVAETV